MADYDIDNDARDVLQDFIDNSPEGLESDEQLEAPLIIDLDEVNKEAQIALKQALAQEQEMQNDLIAE